MYSNSFLCPLLIILVTVYPLATAGEGRSLQNLRGQPTTIGESRTTPSSSDKASSLALLPTHANLTVPLHAHSGSHHVHVYIGSPPQRQTLIVDTGSRLMAFPCKSCKSCGVHTSPYFDPKLSTTQRSPKCGNCKLEGISSCSLFSDACSIGQRYTEGSSWKALELEDFVWLGTNDVTESVEDHMQLAVPYVFGCQTNLKGLFRKQYADGILGLARHETSIVAKYKEHGAIGRNCFSLCLTQDGGLLSLGGPNTAFHLEKDMAFTPITREHGWYSIELVRVQVGLSTLASKTTNREALQSLNRGKGFILDSGTTDTYLPASLAVLVKKVLDDEASMGTFDLTGKQRTRLFTYDEFRALPELRFDFANNATISFVPDNYMEGVPIDAGSGRAQKWNGRITLTNRVYFEEKEGAVLGSNAFYGYDLLFDHDGHQVGIAKALCSGSAAGIQMS